MRILTATLLCALACLLCGCGKYYYQPSKTLTECKQDARDCWSELQKYNDHHADEDPARYNIAYDYEGKFLDTCMKEKGYDIVTEPKLPLRVKREKPDPWDLYDRGLAGQLD